MFVLKSDIECYNIYAGENIIEQMKLLAHWHARVKYVMRLETRQNKRTVYHHKLERRFLLNPILHQGTSKKLQIFNDDTYGVLIRGKI